MTFITTSFKTSASTRPDRATRELLELCRREHIPVTLFTTPEGSAFRGWYTPAARRAVNEYLTGIESEYGVVVTDARTWLADSDFTDSHHPLKRGRRRLTKRLGREVLEPLVQGRLGYKALAGVFPSDK